MFAADEEQDLWLADPARQTLTRLTFDPVVDSYPVWSPDGGRIMFVSQRAGGGVYWQSADGTGVAERLTESGTPTGVSSDGMRLVVNQFGGKEGSDVMSVILTGNHEVRPLVQTPFNERNGIVSPDAQWLAYESDSSGRFEIYVRKFSDPASGQWQVSTAGGTRPLWARNGKELFYLGLDGALMRVPVEAAGPAWNAGTPMKILESRYLGTGSFPGRTYDISPDGQRFLMIKPMGADQSAGPPQIVVVQNWHEELKRLVSVN